jgi:hypothetical protein
MTDIRKKPFATDTLTIHKLKEILSVLPDTDENGDDYEVWIGNLNDFTSSPVKSVWSLNKTENGCDIIFEA